MPIAGVPKPPLANVALLPALTTPVVTAVLSAPAVGYVRSVC